MWVVKLVAGLNKRPWSFIAFVVFDLIIMFHLIHVASGLEVQRLTKMFATKCTVTDQLLRVALTTDRAESGRERNFGTEELELLE